MKIVKKQLGISSWSYPWAVGVPGYPAPVSPLTAFDLVKRAKTLGVGVVQIADNLPLHLLKNQELKELRKLSDELGITMEAGTRGVEPDHLYKYLEIAEILNAKILRTLTHTSDSHPEIAQIEEWLKQVLPQFERPEW